MSIVTIYFIAVGLSMDAFAVALTSGFTIRRLRLQYALRIAVFFGGFQAVMPFIGWLAGYTFRDYITSFDHWVAFLMLLFIGGKMIYESYEIEKSEKADAEHSISALIMLAVATSIDALAVGITFAFLNLSIMAPVIIIGVTTFIFSLAGVYLGKRFGSLLENKIELAGGIILILIGLKILFEHILGK